VLSTVLPLSGLHRAAAQAKDLSSSDILAGVSVSPTAIGIAEDGDTATYQLVLTSQPQDLVIITVTTDGQTTVSHTVLVFDENNWYVPQTVSVAAVDDRVAEGLHSSTISHSISSRDSEYSALEPDDVIAGIRDNDTAGIAISPPALTVSEPAGSAAFTITLTSEPVLSVTIPLTTSNGECGLLLTAAVLRPDSWDEGVSVSVLAADDDVDDGSQTCVIETGTTSSSDPVYNGRNPDDVIVTVEDDDDAGILVAPAELTVSEPDGTAVFTITLTSEPEAAITIPMSALNGECAVWPASITLQSSNWHRDVGMTVAAVDDDVTDGPQTCVVRTQPASSSDPKYNGVDPADVIVTVLDDEGEWSVLLPQIVRGWPPLPGVPGLQAIGNADGDGSYAVTWSAAPRAETYILEEARDIDFSDATEIYAGPSTSYSVVGHGAARLHYRVKARNAWGDSIWSGTRQVDVLWEAEPNDLAASQANGPIVSGLTYYGTFPAGDINDYYYFDLSVVSSAEFWLRSIPTGHNYDLILRDAALNPVGYSGELGSTDEHIVTSTLPAARYYLQIYHRDTEGSTQSYHLEVHY
jgi:hypothetical protein